MAKKHFPTGVSGGKQQSNPTWQVDDYGNATFASVNDRSGTSSASSTYVVVGGALGTPSSGTATNITGLPVSSGVSGLGTNVATFLATPSSANLRGALTDETGTGAAVFATSPTITGATVNGITDLSATPTRTLILTAAGATPTTTIGASVPTVIEAGTNDIDYYVVDFDASTEERVFWNVVLPDNYGGGTVTAIFYWTNAGGGSGEDVVWGIKARAFANDDAIDQAYGTEVTVSDDWIAQNDVQVTAATGAITIGGSPAGGQYFVFNIGRKVASDDLTGDARLLSVKIEYTANAYSD